MSARLEAPDAYGRLCGVRQRVTVVTLGMRDLARARRLYEALAAEGGVRVAE
jgi:hypothetical protein